MSFLLENTFINQMSNADVFLPLSGGIMSGAISQPIAPIDPNDLANKAYIDSEIAAVSIPDASTTIKGKVQLAGDLGGIGTTAAAPIISNVAITNPKVNPGGASTLKGTNSLTSVDDIILGSGLSLTAGAGPTLSVDSATLPKDGATQFGVVEFSGSSDLVETAPNSGIGVVKNAAITNPKVNPGGPSTLKGTNSLTNVDDIVLGSGLSLTSGAGPTLSVDSATLPKAGAAQFGVVEFSGSGDLVETAPNSGIGVVKNVAITNPKVNPGGASTLKGTNSLTNVDDIVLGSGLSLTAGAGPTLSVNQASLNKAGNAQFGVVEFDPTGDLTETALNSGIGVVKNAAITNSKLADMSGFSQLKGSSNINAVVTDIVLGTGLSISGNTLNATGVAAPNAGITQFGLVEFNPIGDLSESSLNSGIGIVKNVAITNPKVNPGGPSTLKGTNSLSEVDDILLGSGLSLTAGAGPTLSVNSATLPKAGATQFGAVEFSGSGDLTETAPNSGIGVVKPLAITNPKVNPGGASTLKGTNSLSDVDDILLGSGLSLTIGASPTLSVDSVTLPKAGAAQFGAVEFSASGDLVQTSLNSGVGVVKNSAITNPKVNPGGPSTLKGTNSLTSVDDIILGSGLSLSAGAGPTLSVNSTTLPKAGATQFGVVEFSGSGDLVQTAPNSGIGVVKPLAITNDKLANTAGNGQLKGSSQGSSTVTDLIVGTGLALSGNTLNATAGVLNVFHSTTVYTVPAAGTPSLPIALTDYTVEVNPGNGVKINYSWNFQSQGGGAAYAPSFGWTGPSITDFFQAHFPGLFNGTAPFSTTIFQTTPPDFYTLSTTNNDASFTQTLALTTAGLYGPALAIYCNVYYINTGVTPVFLTPIFNKDLKNVPGVAIQIAGGWMDYTYF
jgi:hypothetical protein